MPNDWVRTLSASVNSRSSEIPKTRYGITSGEKTSAETTGLPKNRRRRSANEVRTPSVTAIRLEIVATAALRPSAVTRTRFDRTSPYQWVVKPASGNDGSPSLNENRARTAIGRDRENTRSQKKTVSETRPALEVAISIS